MQSALLPRSSLRSYRAQPAGHRPDTVDSAGVYDPACPVTGRLSDHVGSRMLGLIGMVITAGGMVRWLCFFVGNTGTGCLRYHWRWMAVFSPPNMSAIMGSVDRSQLVLASAFLGTMRFCGQGLPSRYSVLLPRGTWVPRPVGSSLSENRRHNERGGFCRRFSGRYAGRCCGSAHGGAAIVEVRAGEPARRAPGRVARKVTKSPRPDGRGDAKKEAE
jgi:hypothetical protein